MTSDSSRIAQLASALEGQADAFIVPSNDEFQGEYTPDYAKRLQWLTGFTGSAGTLVVLARPHEGRDAAFFTDGRYTIQARAQVGDGVHHLNSGDMPTLKWLSGVLPPNGTIGYDPWLHTRAQVKAWKKHLRGEQKLVALEANPVDALWHDRPAPPREEAYHHPLEWAGQGSDEKIAAIAEVLKEKHADAVLLALPDGINWLLNIRGGDVPYNPLLLCFALVSAQGAVTLFTHRHTEDLPVDESVDCVCISDLAEDPHGWFANIPAIMMDPASCAEWFFVQAKAAGCSIVEEADPTLLPKARKNEAERKGIREAHRRDGVALTKFLHWLQGELASRSDVSELEVEEKLEAFRADSNLYRGPSFATIAGAGAHGAIVHYRATPETNRTVGDGELLLIDSGGQYPDGTTDVTRTVVRGTPTPEMKDRFTRVLKGHIALATATFPKGTTGAQLDALARQFLWQAGLDYDHGTGHGVGAFLCVHEGPQRIGKRGGDVALEVGMILSNEPGYYKAGEYGIRIENLVMVVEAQAQDSEKKFLAFETLTFAPIDERLIDWSIMSEAETSWLKDYHARVAANKG